MLAVKTWKFQEFHCCLFACFLSETFQFECGGLNPTFFTDEPKNHDVSAVLVGYDLGPFRSASCRIQRPMDRVNSAPVPSSDRSAINSPDWLSNMRAAHLSGSSAAMFDGFVRVGVDTDTVEYREWGGVRLKGQGTIGLRILSPANTLLNLVTDGIKRWS